MKRPRIGVLMPVYNLEHYVSDSVESILNQTYDGFDFWIIDDGSTDGTYKKVSRFKDSRIKLISNDGNIGFVNTLNAALDEMDYEFIARMDGDDFAIPTRLEKQIQHMDAFPDCVLNGTQTKWVKFGMDGTKTEMPYWKYPTRDSALRASLIWNASFVHSSVLLRKNSLGDLRYDPSFDVACEDWDLWTRLSNKGMICNLDEPLMECAIRENSMHRHNKSRTNELYLRKISSNLERLGLDKDSVSILTAEFHDTRADITFGALKKSYLMLLNLIDNPAMRRDVAQLCGLRLLGQIRDYDYGKLNALSVFCGPLNPGAQGLNKIKSYLFN